jgi:hypothetical protein
MALTRGCQENVECAGCHLPQEKLLCHFCEVNPTVVQMNVELKSAPTSAMWKDPLDNWHHNMIHEIRPIELVLRSDQIHEVETLPPPHHRGHAFRKADRRFGFCCHIVATNRPLCRTPRFKIEPALILSHKFAAIVPLHNLEHWQKLATFCEPRRLQLGCQLVWDPSNMKVFITSELRKPFNTAACETRKTSASE